MRKPSNTTLKRRIKEHRCPFCGSGRQYTRVYPCEYPERAIYTYCENCDRLLEYTDNSPWYSIWEELEKIKSLTLEKAKKVYRAWKLI